MKRTLVIACLLICAAGCTRRQTVGGSHEKTSILYDAVAPERTGTIRKNESHAEWEHRVDNELHGAAPGYH